jgi:2-(1,2-epoxy-1,2-dihydrophenyl)acetyl-CoA isomerase
MVRYDDEPDQRPRRADRERVPHLWGQAMTTTDFSWTLDGTVAVVELARPTSMNALSDEMVFGLTRTFESFRADSEVRAVVLTGQGRAFCAGGDVKVMSAGLNRTPATVRAGMLSKALPLLRAVCELEKPVIAAVNGPAYGAGFSLALACDFVLAASSATFSAAFVRRGLVPDYGATLLLANAVGTRRAKELFMRGTVLDVAAADQLGLLTSTHADEELRSAALELGRDLASGPTLAMGLMKRLVDRELLDQLALTVDREGSAQGICVQSADHREGVSAFLERRDATFVGN